MAQMFLGVCLEDFCPAPDEDTTFVLKRAHEYVIGPDRNGSRLVCSQYWTTVPSRLFAGVVCMYTRKPESEIPAKETR